MVLRLENFGRLTLCFESYVVDDFDRHFELRGDTESRQGQQKSKPDLVKVSNSRIRSAEDVRRGSHVRYGCTLANAVTGRSYAAAT